uniref:HTH tetR-type domain-containing protein n=1 Tax=Candidatus Enterococcus clewellii TaxID=1834193 RepID=A0A242K3C5_9ENTE|nr:hypothetical protein A5888_003474 [Enterococcus sp. 9E7_DIV0242]
MVNRMNSYRNAITKESIFTALMILMEKKDFHKISITEVTSKAGVSRMAFYRNYEILEDVITDYLTTFFAKYEEKICLLYTSSYPYAYHSTIIFPVY